MKEFISVYNENQEDIGKFIIATLKNNSSLLNQEPTNYKKIFESFPSMELVYITDCKFNQISANVFRDKVDNSQKDRSRDYLNSKVTKKDEEFAISSPYISSATGSMTITVRKEEENKYIFIDFNLSILLGRLGLIELNQAFSKFTTTFYKLVGFSLMAFAFFAVGYAILEYVSSIFIEANFSLDALFKPIVALTLGLAIFDLAKTILEREVFFKNYSDDDEDSNVLTKFSIAIIIALSIEALMVVFKIALHDYTQMIYALYLITGIAFIIISLAIYSYLSNKK